MQHLQKRQEIEEIRRRSASFMRFEADFSRLFGSSVGTVEENLGLSSFASAGGICGIAQSRRPTYRRLTPGAPDQAVACVQQPPSRRRSRTRKPLLTIGANYHRRWRHTFRGLRFASSHLRLLCLRGVRRARSASRPHLRFVIFAALAVAVGGGGRFQRPLAPSNGMGGMGGVCG
jgi:hypothetical protein